MNATNLLQSLEWTYGQTPQFSVNTPQTGSGHAGKKFDVSDAAVSFDLI